MARRPWFAICLAFLVSFDLAIYALSIDVVAYLLVDHSRDLGNDLMIQVALKLILPLMLATFVLAVGDRALRLTHI
ncbi:hypothetical protein M407DRAFT_242143 [Tulasnella calospora MUT 4182]|uniref:Uncharacterized protein n=1 Tax=Tulasnella calospora MUT 4182 TaxID=1051891 RepID=A0A0C3QGA5_9AGAM|nr:hypothetical protein M407DRAFT_242143 [Tulasnella calospora MUT 4182]